MLKRLLISFTLALLFGLGQQGAAVHEISHYADLAPNPQQQDKAPHSSVCDKCLSYGELASALAVSHHSPPLLAAGFEPYIQHGSSYPDRTLAAYSARAPPVLA